ncbi:MAG: flagellar basal-body rod protein FlgF [Pirellulales bacterium]|nr:flagellar basal-body rod protein FlgF [Pirellulales bacterium]
MPTGLYVSAEGANAQARRLEVIANNLANVDTVGFKQDLAVFQARYTEGIEEGLIPPDTGAIEDEGGGTTTWSTATNFSPGPLKHTGRPLDMAINGEGFFAVLKDGETHLTRAGNFVLTSRGELVTQQGYPVLGATGTPIVVTPENGPWEFASDGTIRQPGAAQSLALFSPASLGELVKVGENLFLPMGDTLPVDPTKRNVTNGYVEGSGVEPATETVDMIATSRMFEANTKMMQIQDDMLSGLVNRLMRLR